jgi:hypothetical protein
MYVDVLEARDRFLKPGGRMVPSEASLYLAPIEADEAYEDWVGRWCGAMAGEYGLDLEPLERLAMTQPRRRVVPPEGVLASPARIHHLELERVPPAPVDLESDPVFAIERGGCLQGLVGFFEVLLSGGVSLSTAPAAEETHWKQQFFPLPAMEVEQGDRLECRVRVRHSPVNTRTLEVGLRCALHRGEECLGEAEVRYPET